MPASASTAARRACAHVRPGLRSASDPSSSSISSRSRSGDPPQSSALPRSAVPVVIDRRTRDFRRALRHPRHCATTERRHVARLRAGLDRRAAHRLAHVSRNSQTRLSIDHGQCAGLDLGPCLPGTALLIIATLHAGFQVGWNLHTLAYILMCVVIASGFFGLYSYLNNPQLISKNREGGSRAVLRSEEHTSELQSQSNLVCRLLLEKKKK